VSEQTAFLSETSSATLLQYKWLTQGTSIYTASAATAGLKFQLNEVSGWFCRLTRPDLRELLSSWLSCF
jgi:hypothetical protein